jgi:hypothetical protein
MRFRDLIAAVKARMRSGPLIFFIGESGIGTLKCQSHLTSKTSISLICEIAIESGPSDLEMIRTVDHSSYRSFGDREFKRARTQCNKNPISRYAKSRLNLDRQIQEMIRTVDHSPYRSFGDRDLEVTRTLNIRNVEIAICDMAI